MTLPRLLLLPFSLALLLVVSSCGEQEQSGPGTAAPTDARMATIFAQPALSTLAPSPTASGEPDVFGSTAVPAIAESTPIASPTPILATEQLLQPTAVPGDPGAAKTEPAIAAAASSTPSLSAPSAPATAARPLPTAVPQVGNTNSSAPSATAPAATVTPDETAVPQATATQLLATAAVQSPTPAATAVGPGQSDASHFSNCVTRTGSNATIAVPADTVVQGDMTFSAGDEIAVFTPDGGVCAGVAVWTGQNIAITAWGDDSQTEVLDGLREGEQMRFKIWRKGTAQETAVQAVTFSLGDGLYATDSLHAIESLTLAAGARKRP